MREFFELLTVLAEGPFISIASVKGQAVAAGLGIAAACDIVVAQAGAQFGLSELLFGMLPACVAPFVTRRVGISKTKFLALSTLLVNAEEARSMGLVDIVVDDNAEGIRRILARLRRVQGASIRDCKRLFATLGSIHKDEEMLVRAGAATTHTLAANMRNW
jgi:polyketide biosynthesis enoyl-CoA hydratase PksH